MLPLIFYNRIYGVNRKKYKGDTHGETDKKTREKNAAAYANIFRGGDTPGRRAHCRYIHQPQHQNRQDRIDHVRAGAGTAEALYVFFEFDAFRI